jgi:tellurite resistance protein TehA-like permease
MPVILNPKKNAMKVDYELKAKKNKVIGEFGYGIMWLFLSLLIEVLLYLGSLVEIYYHILAFILLIPAVNKFIMAIKKYRNLTEKKI